MPRTAEPTSSSRRSNLRTRAGIFIEVGAGIALALGGCSLLATRPVQEMSDTAAAIRAAREVQADTLAPELYRRSLDEFTRAKREYRLKSFDLAKDAAIRARRIAEEAEFQAIQKGGARGENGSGMDPYADLTSAEPPPPPDVTTPPPPPYAYPKQRGIPLESYDQRMGSGSSVGGSGSSPSGSSPPPASANTMPTRATPQPSNSPYGFR